MDPHTQFSAIEIDAAVGRFAKRIDNLEKCVQWLSLMSTDILKDSMRIREPDKKAPKFTYCVKYHSTQRSQWLIAQQGVGGTRLGQYFLRHGWPVKLDFMNQLWHPIRIRVFQRHGSDPTLHEVLPGAEIVLGSCDDPNGTHTGCVEIGRVMVHQKHPKTGRSEVVLRVQATRLVHGCENRWKTPNLIGTFDVDCLVVNNNNNNNNTTTTTTNDGDVGAKMFFYPSSLVSTDQ